MIVPVLNRYCCRAPIWAEKIINIRYDHNAKQHISWILDNGDMIIVSAELICRGGSCPVGGYYVLFGNGQEDWLSADTFDKCFVKLEDNNHGR
jgi:hypothetical protein